MTTATDPKRISYDRETRDYAAMYDGELIGFYPSYHAAEVALDAYALELAIEGLSYTATELDQELA